MARTPARDDLFVLFPDLPWHPRRTASGQMERVQRQVHATQARVDDNIVRQRAATERVRAEIRRRRSDVRQP
jgi:hypothetical protein